MKLAPDTSDVGDRDLELPAPLEEIRRVAAALGDRRRCQIIGELRVGPLAVHELVERTGLRQPLVSHHLGVLRRAGLVRDVPDGRLRRYRLEDDASGAARMLLDLIRPHRDLLMDATKMEPLRPPASVPARSNGRVRSPKVDSGPAAGEPRPEATEVRPMGPQIEDYLL